MDLTITTVSMGFPKMHENVCHKGEQPSQLTPNDHHHPKTPGSPSLSVPEMEISGAGVFVLASFVEKYGIAAGTLLSQICYWFYKASEGKSHWIVERFGYRWLADTREQFSDETGMPLSTIRGALERLQASGAIVVEQHLFECKNVSHIRFG